MVEVLQRIVVVLSVGIVGLAAEQGIRSARQLARYRSPGELARRLVARVVLRWQVTRFLLGLAGIIGSWFAAVAVTPVDRTWIWILILVAALAHAAAQVADLLDRLALERHVNGKGARPVAEPPGAMDSAGI